ncbi:MAG: DUF711 family protein [candidate division NC10 bacterium]|nr:DUF711 family protein [candidate division NC10 bacterium]
MKIRSITVGVNLSSPLNEELVRQAGRFARQAKEAFEEQGIEVQTLRLATQPFPEYLGDASGEEILRFALELEKLCVKEGIEYVSIGPATSDETDRDLALMALIPRLIQETERLFASITIGTGAEGIKGRAVREAARVIKEISHMTDGGFGNLRFAALANCPPYIPFFPAAYHQGDPAFTLALQAADIVAQAFHGGPDLPTATGRLREAMEEKIRPIQMIAEGLADNNFAFKGIDLSPAPAPGDATSIAYAMEGLTGRRFGQAGTLTAAALITQVLKTMNLKACGYSGLMLPVLEDSGLAARNREGTFRLMDLLTLSAVSGTGLDTIPLPGEITLRELEAILLDVASLATALRKPLSARLFPIPGKEAGEMTTFEFPYFTNTTIFQV